MAIPTFFLTIEQILEYTKLKHVRKGLCLIFVLEFYTRCISVYVWDENCWQRLPKLYNVFLLRGNCKRTYVFLFSTRYVHNTKCWKYNYELKLNAWVQYTNKRNWKYICWTVKRQSQDTASQFMQLQKEKRNKYQILKRNNN